MTEDDRMERAKRIRRMREGKRVGDDADEETEDDPEPAQADAEPTGADLEPAAGEDAETSSPSPAAEGDSGPEPATTDGGTGQVTEDAAGDAEDADDGSEADAAGSDLEAEADDAVDQGSGTRAPLPSAEEMAAALDDDPAPAGEQDDSEAAQAVAEASAARTEAAAGAAAESGEQAEPGAEERVEADADEPAAAEADAEEPAPAGAGRAGATSTAAEDQTRVLEFTLGDEQYCLDIQYIEEIVKQEHITRVPNTPDFVEGVVDLRGQITTILNPKVTIGKEDTETGDLIVVFDGDGFEDQGHVGWIVDDVRQVSPVTDDQINDPPMDDDHIQAVIDREEDDEFVVWTTPELAFEDAQS